RRCSFRPRRRRRSCARSAPTPTRLSPTRRSKTSSPKPVTWPRALRPRRWDSCSNRKSPNGAPSSNRSASRSISARAHQSGPPTAARRSSFKNDGGIQRKSMTPLSLRQRAWPATWAFVALVLFAASAARAQDYPNRTVTIVAPSAPGGMYSILARLIGSKLERLYGQSFVIENRPGASSITGSVFVAHAAPAGYTLMTAASTTMATNVSLHRNLPYDPLTDFIPIIQIARSPEVLLVNAALPVRSIEDLVKLARSTTGGLSFGSAGPGTGQHLNGELLKMRLGIPMQH